MATKKTQKKAQPGKSATRKSAAQARPTPKASASSAPKAMTRTATSTATPTPTSTATATRSSTAPRLPETVRTTSRSALNQGPEDGGEAATAGTPTPTSTPTSTPTPTPTSTATATPTATEQVIEALDASLAAASDSEPPPSEPGVQDADIDLTPPDDLVEETTEDDDEPPPSSVGAGAPPSVEEVQAQIAELESRLDRMIKQSARKSTTTRSVAESAARAVQEKILEPLPIERPGGDEGNVLEAARELLSTDYYLRQWSRLGMRNRSEEVDEFGLDPKYEARLQPILDFLYKRYFRVETTDADRIPSDGRCLIVSNHSGTLPFDGLMLKTALRHAHPAQRELRWLAEDFIFYLPFLGAFMNRVGAVRACQENAERLLRHERLVAVFPEGVKGIGKLYRDRYRLQRFGRGGFIRLCLRTQTPIVPCAIIGAEEASPMLYRVEHLAKLFGVPYVPVTPTFPALGPLGLVPAPTKWRIAFGEPLHFDGYGPEAADDALLVGRLSERVRATIQAMIDRGLSERQSVWFG